jgi:hypothetical protein
VPNTKAAALLVVNALEERRVWPHGPREMIRIEKKALHKQHSIDGSAGFLRSRPSLIVHEDKMGALHFAAAEFL